MAERDLVVRFIGDDRSLNQAFTRQERRVKQFDTKTAAVGANLRTAFAAAGISLGTAAVFTQIQKAVTAASDLNEQVSKSRQVFGDASAGVEKWSQTTAEAFGISQRQALAAAGTFGNLFRVIDLAPQQAAEMSRSLVQLAADLASFNNASPEEVLVAIRSGLIGEAEPLRRYGVLLSEARVQQRALAATGKDNVKTLTDQEKALARYAIILDDTASAQGDFSRTSDGLANQTRTLRANFDDLSANLGGVLIPVLADLTAAANLAFVGLEKLGNLDVSPGFDFPELPDWLTSAASVAPISPLGAVALGIKKAFFEVGVASDDVSRKLNAGLSPALRETTTDAQGYTRSVADAADRSRDLAHVSTFLGSAMADAGSRMQAAADNAKNLADETARAAAAAEKRFTTSIKGLQLKLEKAQLTTGLQDDLAVLDEILARINRRIRAEGRTFELEQERVRVLAQIKSVQEQIASGEAAAASDAASAAKARAQADKDEETRRQRAARAAAQRRRDRIRGDQFALLGLDREGEPRIPGVRSLRRRAATLQEQIKGTALDTQRTRTQLRRIARVLSGEFGKVGKDVREAILAMLADITNALKQSDKTLSGPLTKTSSLNSRKITEGLGLSQDEIRELRSRLSNFNSAGIGFGGAPRTSTTGGAAGGFGGVRGQIELESHITVNIDGKKVASIVTKQQQKGSRRNPRQKRGPNRITQPGI